MGLVIGIILAVIFAPVGGLGFYSLFKRTDIELAFWENLYNKGNRYADQLAKLLSAICIPIVMVIIGFVVASILLWLELVDDVSQKIEFIIGVPALNIIIYTFISFLAMFSSGYKHQTKSGKKDKRYKDNPVYSASCWDLLYPLFGCGAFVLLGMGLS
ncbi:hypothetical protein A4G18_04370 [Pasteurellaceae bacterium Pebbles2]|nr:hypothetical protein [Pasteurellaceae bacterium Pebbles2]